MEENRVAAPEARTLGHSGQETADKIIRNAETRSGSEQDAQSRPQGRQARSSYLGMSREPEAGAAADEPASLSSLSSGLGESKPSTEQSANPEAGERTGTPPSPIDRAGRRTL